MKRLGMALALLAFAGEAKASIIDLAPALFAFGPVFSQDGYTFAGDYQADAPYINWVRNGFLAQNAFNGNGGITHNVSGFSTTITNSLGHAFDFSSIQLADGLNNGHGGLVQFTFNHVGGSVTSQNVVVDNLVGSQTVLFNQTNLLSVVLLPLTTQGQWIQFDGVGVAETVVAPAVPEASTWAMMILGFSGVGLMARRARRKLVLRLGQGFA